jgi:hypothetical protein
MMAARRLIMAMIGLLAISVLISVFIQPPAERNGDADRPASEGAAAGTTSTTADGTNGPTGASGRADRSQDGGPAGDDGPADGQVADNRTVSAAPLVGADPAVVCIRPGYRLILSLRARRTIEISVPDFGRVATATQFAPAVFDLLMPDDPGRFPVEELGTQRRLVTINSGNGCGPPGLLS